MQFQQEGDVKQTKKRNTKPRQENYEQIAPLLQQIRGQLKQTFESDIDLVRFVDNNKKQIDWNQITVSLKNEDSKLKAKWSSYQYFVKIVVNHVLHQWSSEEVCGIINKMQQVILARNEEIMDCRDFSEYANLKSDLLKKFWEDNNIKTQEKAFAPLYNKVYKLFDVTVIKMQLVPFKIKIQGAKPIIDLNTIKNMTGTGQCDRLLNQQMLELFPKEIKSDTMTETQRQNIEVEQVQNVIPQENGNEEVVLQLLNQNEHTLQRVESSISDFSLWGDFDMDMFAKQRDSVID